MPSRQLSWLRPVYGQEPDPFGDCRLEGPPALGVFFSWVTPEDIDDRDVILFPEKIGGRFALLRRPIGFVDTDSGHSEAHPSIRISYSADLNTRSEPEVVIRPQFKWEDNRIGGATPPVRTERGWLVLYHGVENMFPATRRVVYRLGDAARSPRSDECAGPRPIGPAPSRRTMEATARSSRSSPCSTHDNSSMNAPCSKGRFPMSKAAFSGSLT